MTSYHLIHTEAVNVTVIEENSIIFKGKQLLYIVTYACRYNTRLF